MLEHFRSQSVPVANLSIVLNSLEDGRELGEDLAHHELLRQGECFYIGVGQVEELGLQVLSEIEGTEVVFGSLEVRKSVVLAIHRSHVDGVADADVTVDNEVHL